MHDSTLAPSVHARTLTIVRKQARRLKKTCNTKSKDIFLLLFSPPLLHGIRQPGEFCPLCGIDPPELLHGVRTVCENIKYKFCYKLYAVKD
jgi:hypothetical protein